MICFWMPLLSRKRGNKSVLSQKDSKSVDGTQSSESCPMDVNEEYCRTNIWKTLFSDHQNEENN